MGIAAAASLAAALIYVGSWVATLPAMFGAPLPVSAAGLSDAPVVANCRYGVAVSEPWISSPLVKTLGIGWYIYYDAPQNPPPGTEAAHVVYVRQDKSGGTYLNSYTPNVSMASGALRAWVQSVPGSLWIIANEPDRGPLNPSDPNRVQGDTYPAMYAREYHDLYQYIKAADPTAQVAIGGLVEATPGRMQYLDIVWNTYQSQYGTPMPVDVWTMHLYVMPEANHDGTAPIDIASIALGTNPALAKRESNNDNQFCTNPIYYCYKQHDDMGKFDEQVRLMRTWMAQHAQQSKPLMLTEYSILYAYMTPAPPPWNNRFACWIVDELRNCFTPGRISQFVRNSFAYLSSETDLTLGDPQDNYKLVQQWAWFGLNFGNGDVWSAAYASNLLTDGNPFYLTQAGAAFRDAGLALPHTINLSPTQTLANSFYWGANGVVGRVTVGLINNGSVAPAAPVLATVYADAGLTQPLGSGYITRAPGCARRESFATVDITLPYALTGSGPYWVKLDAANSLAETNENDNVIQGSYNYSIKVQFLPIVAR